MDDMDINNTPLETSPKKSTGKKVMLTIVILLLLVAVGVGGYFWGKMNQDKEVEQAKTTVKEATLKQAAADLTKAKTDAQKSATTKTATETTCNADELMLATATSGESGAGTIAYDLVLTNVGKRTCTLGGFPGVSFVNNNGNQIGTPAERAMNYTEKKLTLAPNAKVKAVVSTSNSANFSDGQCKAGATKFRVYPPSDTGYLSVVSPVNSWCSGFKISPVLSV